MEKSNNYLEITCRPKDGSFIVTGLQVTTLKLRADERLVYYYQLNGQHGRELDTLLGIDDSFLFLKSNLSSLVCDHRDLPLYKFKSQLKYWSSATFNLRRRLMVIGQKLDRRLRHRSKVTG